MLWFSMPAVGAPSSTSSGALDGAGVGLASVALLGVTSMMGGWMIHATHLRRFDHHVAFVNVRAVGVVLACSLGAPMGTDRHVPPTI